MQRPARQTATNSLESVAVSTNILLHACRACKFRFELNWHSNIHADLGSATSQVESPASAPSSTAQASLLQPRHYLLQLRHHLLPRPPLSRLHLLPRRNMRLSWNNCTFWVSLMMRALRVTNGDVNEAMGILLGGI